MSTPQFKIVITGLSFLLIFLLGFWLSRSGKPYNLVIFTFHKLVVVGAIVFLAKTIYTYHLATPLNLAQVLSIVIMILCFAVTMITGALLSMDKIMPLIVIRLHQFIPYLTLLTSTVTLYLILVNDNGFLKPS